MIRPSLSWRVGVWGLADRTPWGRPSRPHGPREEVELRLRVRWQTGQHSNFGIFCCDFAVFFFYGKGQWQAWIQVPTCKENYGFFGIWYLGGLIGIQKSWIQVYQTSDPSRLWHDALGEGRKFSLARKTQLSIGLKIIPVKQAKDSAAQKATWIKNIKVN